MRMTNKPHKRTLMRHLKGWGIIAIMVLTFLVYIIESKGNYNYKVYQVENGFGYHILRGDKIMIQQNFIPTINAYQPFIKKKHAEKAAKLVVKKLKDNKVPALSSEEVKAIITS